MSDLELADYGLQPGQLVRFRRKIGGHWTKAKVGPLNKDGSVTFWTQDGRHQAVSLFPTPETIEVKQIGPKGGITWIPWISPQTN